MVSRFRELKLRLACALLFLNHTARNAAAIPANRTIDDQFGDSVTGSLPIYFPENKWAQGSQCPGCFAQPDYQQAFRHTWHDATLHSGDPESELSISMMFTGMAIYAYCIIDNYDTYTTFTNLTFSIDGMLVGSYSHRPDGSATYLYNTLVYANVSIPNSNHTFMIHLPRGTDHSFVLFDFVAYTYDDNSTPSPSSTSAFTTSSTLSTSTFTRSSASPTSVSTTSPPSSATALASKSPSVTLGAIVGGAVAAVVVLALVAITFFLLGRCKRRSNTSPNMASASPWRSTISTFPQQPAEGELHSGIGQSAPRQPSRTFLQRPLVVYETE